MLLEVGIIEDKLAAITYFFREISYLINDLRIKALFHADFEYFYTNSLVQNES